MNLRKWQKTSDEDWSQNKSLGKRIKHAAKKKKQGILKDFAEGLLKASPKDGIATIYTIIKFKTGYQAEHSAISKSLTSEVMTKHIP